jgi:hypothetical protein
LEVLVPRNGTVSELLASLHKKANLDDEAMREMRICEAHSGKIYKELRDDNNVSSINEYATLYAERMPADEVNMDESDRVINVFNFDKEPNRTHGVPFKFVMKPVSCLLAVAEKDSIADLCRARSLRKPRNVCRNGRGSRASSSRRSSLLLFLALLTQTSGT